MELDHFKPIRIVLDPNAGSTIHECKIEALRLCLEHGIDVEFRFNDIPYAARYKTIMESVKQHG
jgi:hypothetical protein